MNKHTPGPWNATTQNGVHWVDDPKGNPVVHWAGFDSSFSREQNEANARLIASAPDLLAALESLVSRCYHFGGSKGGKMDISQARAAIKKATGA